MGKEGRQAVRCSDFALARFKFLKKVLLVHGHWYYVRVSTLVQYSFYKNVAFITPQVFFAIWSAFSTQVRVKKVKERESEKKKRRTESKRDRRGGQTEEKSIELFQIYPR